jgi:hypothetical protein
MADTVAIVTTLALFLVTLLYVSGCSGLKRSRR